MQKEVAVLVNTTTQCKFMDLLMNWSIGVDRVGSIYLCQKRKIVRHKLCLPLY